MVGTDQAIFLDREHSDGTGVFICPVAECEIKSSRSLADGIFDPNGSFGYREKDYKISARGAKAFLEHGNADIDFGRYDLKRIVNGQGGGRDGDWYGA